MKKLQIQDTSFSLVPKPTKSPRIENQIFCHLISIYNSIKEIQKITNVRYFLLSKVRTIASRKPLSITLVKSNRGKKERIQKFKIGRCHRKCSISKFHLPPLRTTRRRKSRVGREQPFPVGLSYSVGITNRISRARDTRLPRSSSTRDT